MFQLGFRLRGNDGVGPVVYAVASHVIKDC